MLSKDKMHLHACVSAYVNTIAIEPSAGIAPRFRDIMQSILQRRASHEMWVTFLLLFLFGFVCIHTSQL